MKHQLDLPPDYEPRVYVVDDDEGVCTSIADLISSMGFTACTYTSAEEFLSETDNRINGCVIADLRLMGCNAIEMLRKMKSKGYEIPLIILSAFVDVTTTVSAMSEGALTVLEKPYAEQELWDHVIAAILLNAEQRFARRWLLEYHSKESRLTVGESEVMRLLLKGLSNKSISHQLDLSARTVVMRRKAIINKLEVDNVIDLAKLITKAQIIEQYLTTDNVVAEIKCQLQE
ncbi:response regulator transcription factor [Gimesia panareensis]|uniref:response regulator transcription factor n=1 Tax=Gimesia panareensis TaxID=2527978 RepID=UPI00118BEAEE|nr:response regulator [Gimesia panareensis]QDU50914.1 Response regulator protein TodT [Gimesia panareensis]